MQHINLEFDNLKYNRFVDTVYARFLLFGETWIILCASYEFNVEKKSLSSRDEHKFSFCIFNVGFC